MQKKQRGFFLVSTLFVITGLLMFSMIGLTRTTTELSSSTRIVAQNNAFQLAEAGVDDVLSTPATLNSVNPLLAGKTSYTLDEINMILRGQNNTCDGGHGDDGALVLPSNSKYKLTVVDNANPTTCTDTDHKVILTAQGQSGTEKRTVLVALELPGPSMTGPYDYVATVGQLDLSGNAKLGYDAGLGGNGAGRVSLHLTNYGDVFNTVSSSEVWVDRVDFDNPYKQPLNDPAATVWPNYYHLCSSCYTSTTPGWGNPTVFPPSRAGEPSAPTYRLSGVTPVDHLTIDLNAYYQKMLQECLAENTSRTAADCAGNIPNRHITTDTTIDGGKSGITLEGIIYVETGAKVIIKNSVTIKGTIVHEGIADPNYGAGSTGIGEISSGPNMALTIDSYAQTDINKDGIKEAPFAPGAAIVGSPLLNFSNNSTFGDGSSTNPGIKGFVMSASQWAGPSYVSNIAATGTIQGGIIGVDQPYYYQVMSGGTFAGAGLEPGVPGPSYQYPYGAPSKMLSNAVLWVGGPLTLGGSSNLRFQPITGAVNGLCDTGGCSGTSGGGSTLTRPKIRAWMEI